MYYNKYYIFKNKIIKLLLLILLCFPVIGFGQACQYGSSTDASEICDYIRGNSFASDRNADRALEMILDATGSTQRFALKECSNIDNAIATTYKGIRYILYDKEFMESIAARTNSWSQTSILAHEIGHHVYGHTLSEAPSLSASRQMELEADEYSGFVMYKLGVSLSQAQEAIHLASTNKDDTYSTHPSKNKRLNAVYKGWNKAKVSNNDYSNSNLTTEDYFYKAYNNEGDYKYQIYNYKKCIELDELSPPSKLSIIANFNLGLSYLSLNDYENAMMFFTTATMFKKDYVKAYKWRAVALIALKDYKTAINDCQRAIKYSSKDDNSKLGEIYRIRAIAKKAAGLNYCDDNRRACELGDELGCSYYKKCR